MDARLTPQDGDYPTSAFAALDDPPPVLFVRGALPPCDQPAVAVVGTREATPYGLRTAREMGEDLARAGVCVVSGLALGVDGAAHRGALAAGGTTVAVLGCGVDVVYPLPHADLRDEIEAHGALVSELPPGTQPRPFHFPRRNRIVAALVQAVVVIEAPVRSGALITARLALDIGRDVLAVPGNVTREAHAGCHRLLKQGAAALCESAADVLEMLELRAPPSMRKIAAGAPSDPVAAVLWRSLDPDEPVDANSLCRSTGLDAAEVAAALTGLEIDGRVLRLPGLGFVRTS